MRPRRHREGPLLLAVVSLLTVPLGGSPAAAADSAPARKSNFKVRVAYSYGPFEEAEESQLESVGEYRASGRIVKLLGPAAQAFREMQAAALRDGIVIVPVSGFRETERQAQLFRRAVRRHGSQRKAARWVAPPGYSHHEAGLALDLGDESAPNCDARSCFRKTAAYKWLRANAARFGFALNPTRSSRPREPWHWRYTLAEETEKAYASEDTTRSD
jgi:D-alanyl-D-alanine carboxypeptidase